MKRARETTELRQKKYFNNVIEQAHRGIKRLTNAGMGFKSFNTARRTLRVFEEMNMIRKGQIKGVTKGIVWVKLSLLLRYSEWLPKSSNFRRVFCP